jgi:hypothetical protein
MNRREMLARIGLLTTSGLLATPAAAQSNAIVSSRVFDVKDYGATADGKTLDTAAIKRTIEACHAAGGGVVFFRAGIFLSGTVVLRSNVTLYLEAGATLLGSSNIADYSPQKKPPVHSEFNYERAEDSNLKHLICAYEAENIGICGFGRIDGQGASFWTSRNRVPVPAERAWSDVATYDWKALDRPSPLIELYRCKNVHLEGVRIENSPGWTLRPVFCDFVFIHGVHIKSPVYGPNTDGIDMVCCQNIFISDCVIDTGDDALCLKSESPYGDAVRASKNITITNCVLSCCCNGFKIGSATAGVFENLIFSNSVIFNEDVPLNARVISGIALEMVDGGSMEGVTISNIRMQRVRTPLFIRLANRTSRPDGKAGILRGVVIDNIQATGSILTSSVTGVPGFDVEDVTMSNIRIESDENGPADWASRKIPENVKSYPEARMFGRLPAYGFYCRHVTGLQLRNIEFRSAPQEARPAIVCEDVKSLDIDGLRAMPTVGIEPMVKLIQTRQALLSHCSAAVGAKTFLEAQGDQTEAVFLTSCNLYGAEVAFKGGSDLSRNAVTVLGNSLRDTSGISRTSITE